MGKQLALGGIVIDVVKKKIKNVHLTVHPPSGAVRISAPARMSTDTIRVFAIAKLPWIRAQQRKLRAQERETLREYLSRESHYVWGKRYLLKVVEEDGPPQLTLTPRTLLLKVRPGTGAAKRMQLIEHWHRAQLKAAIEPLVVKWEPRLGVEVRRFFVQRMKTKWGSCSPGSRSIRLNTELAKKPHECLDYLVLHEMAHLLQPTHNERFVAILNEHLPQWRIRRDALNRLPVRHEQWGY